LSSTALNDFTEKFSAAILCFYLPVANQLLSCSMEKVEKITLQNRLSAAELLKFDNFIPDLGRTSFQ